MEGFEEKWRGSTEEDWTEWIEARLLTVAIVYNYYNIVLCGVITLAGVYIIIILYMNTMCT